MKTPAASKSASSRLVWWFAFLGPLGNLIPVPGTPHSFRFYYLLLLPGILVFFANGVRRRVANTFAIMAPVFLYMMVSAVYAYVSYSADSNASEDDPLVRFFLFSVLLVFTVCAGEEARNFSTHRKLALVRAFLFGYLISLVVGYIFFVGFYLHIANLEFISHFEVLVQWGWGLLRFSPGSYPNEYGVVSSFALSVFTLLFFHRKRLIRSDPVFETLSSTAVMLCCLLFTLGALFLATTRAAYASFLLSLLYIGLSQGGLRKPLVFLGRIAAAGLVLLLCIQPFFDVIGILAGGYHALFNPNDLGNGRVTAWEMAYGFFMEHPYFGTGFGTVDMMHNVYLQMLFGLGIAGSCLLLFTILVLMARARGFMFFRASRPVPEEADLLLHRISAVGLIHICWFALSNHNLNHFLTWFVVLITYAQAGSRQPGPSTTLNYESFLGNPSLNS